MEDAIRCLGFVSIQKHISHYSQGDFSVNSITINGWLRNLLWSEAFSLMFLFSGRAYWQELIESILWSHHKLKIIPHIQPRALHFSRKSSWFHSLHSRRYRLNLGIYYFKTASIKLMLLMLFTNFDIHHMPMDTPPCLGYPFYT